MRSKTDRQKLEMAGITILRVDELGKILKYLQPDGRAWKTWKTFETKAQLEREIKRIDQVELKIIIE